MRQVFPSIIKFVPKILPSFLARFPQLLKPGFSCGEPHLHSAPLTVESVAGFEASGFNCVRYRSFDPLKFCPRIDKSLSRCPGVGCLRRHRSDVSRWTTKVWGHCFFLSDLKVSPCTTSRVGTRSARSFSPPLVAHESGRTYLTGCQHSKTALLINPTKKNC